MALLIHLLLGTPRSRPRAGGGWARPLPSREGVGDGWSSNAAEAVRRLSRPTASLDPPTSSPRPAWGTQLGGSRWDAQAHGLQPLAGIAASRPTCQPAWRCGCSEDAFKGVEHRRLCGWSDSSPGAADEPVRADRLGGPASGVAGDRGDALAGWRDERDALGAQDGQDVKRARSCTREGKRPTNPGHGKGRPNRCRVSRRRSTLSKARHLEPLSDRAAARATGPD
jgi:hypothetical protein